MNLIHNSSPCKKNMQQEVIEMIRPFLLFLKTFVLHNIHNMFAIMLDPCFKTLRIVKNYVGHGVVIHFVSKYDAKVMIPLLIVCFD